MRQHGTYVKYVIEQCRCPECRAANSAYEKRRKRENAERAWGARPPVFVDAAPVREWLFVLSAAGIGPKQVEILAGVGKTAQWKIRSRRVRKCLYATREAILAVTLDSAIFPRSRIDAAPAVALISELLGAGMTKQAIAQKLGARCGVLQVAQGKRVRLETLQHLEALRAEVTGRHDDDYRRVSVKHRTRLAPTDYELDVFGPRLCPACGCTLPANTDYFGVDRTHDDGLTYECLGCRAERGKVRYHAEGRPAPMAR